MHKSSGNLITNFRKYAMNFLTGGCEAFPIKKAVAELDFTKKRDLVFRNEGGREGSKAAFPTESTVCKKGVGGGQTQI